MLGQIQIDPPPRAGTGLHHWAWYASNRLHKCGAAPEEAFSKVFTGLIEAGRRSGAEREAREAIRRAYGGHVTSTAPRMATSIDWTARRRAITTSPGRYGLADLWEASPIRTEDETPAEIITQLFHGSDLICAGTSVKDAKTKPLTDWGAELDALQFIVPNPMQAREGVTQDGKPSARCLGNACERRRYFVAEFDDGTEDEQAAVLAHLADRLPLVLVLTSGGKSLHGWFNFADLNEAQAEIFISYAVGLGADPATRSRCQLVRMPQAMRDNGRRQAVFYFNPKGGRQ